MTDSSLRMCSYTRPMLQYLVLVFKLYLSTDFHVLVLVLEGEVLVLETKVLVLVLEIMYLSPRLSQLPFTNIGMSVKDNISQVQFHCINSVYMRQ